MSANKVDAYAAVLAFLEEQPILTWACGMAGISRQAVYQKRDNDEDFAVKLAAAKARGQAKRLKGASDERVLAWSDPKTFGLKQQIEHEGGIKIEVSPKLADRVAS